MPYTHTSFGQLKAALLARLGGAAEVFWTDDPAQPYSELGGYVIESLRTWGALTGYWRDRATFSLVQNKQFYDLPNTAGPGGIGGPDLLLGSTVKDQDLVAAIQFHLLEPATGNSWTGSDMWTLADVTAALERRRNQFLAETGRVVTRSVQNVGVPPPSGRLPIADTIIDIRRAAWVTPEGVYTNLWRADEWEVDAFSQTANTTPGPPSVFSTALVPPLGVQLIPSPLDGGQLELLSVQTSATLDPTAGVILGIPDDLCWVIKWGALADLLSGSSQGRDQARAGYCEQRWKQGIQLATLLPTVLQAFVDEQQVNILSIADLDADSPGWQNLTPATPLRVAMAGPNLMAVNPPPDANAHSVTLDVMRNTPVPTKDADQIQVGREELDAILDYAFHLAAFKEGGAEFAGSIDSLTRMIRMAAIRNGKLRAQSAFVDALAERGNREEQRRPGREQVDDSQDAGGQQQP